LRETLEETAWDVRLTSLLGLYHYTTADGTCYIRTCFVAEPVQHHPERSLDTGVLRALWMSRAELEARKDQLRSQIVLRVIDDYLAGKRYPLALITSLA
jgi:8-oxo-dGTP pyrophosphatase MutT (NUDIX family)